MALTLMSEWILGLRWLLQPEVPSRLLPGDTTPLCCLMQIVC